MNRLKDLRENAGMNMKEAADALGYKYMRYVNYEKGERTLNSEQLIKIADFYDVTIDYVLGRDDRVIKPPLVKKYEALDDVSRQVVDSVVDLEMSRSAPEIAPLKVIPLFPAAAGPGEPIEGNAIDKCEVHADSAADFAVRISGDSMEPQFKDGEIVLCRQKEAEAGDIAVIMVNGLLLVKQFVPGYGGQWYLRSLNRDRADLDYDHLPSNNDTVTGFGVVIHKRIPMVTP